MNALKLVELVDEHDLAQAYSLMLIEGLTTAQVSWRPSEQSSAIAWHLGHQAAVVHYAVRNLTAAQISFNPAFDRVFDSATPEPDRRTLPGLEEIVAYRSAISESTRAVVHRITGPTVASPNQLMVVADRLLRSLIDHEYQHAKWIEEVRNGFLDAPARKPGSDRLIQVDGYWMVRAV